MKADDAFLLMVEARIRDKQRELRGTGIILDCRLTTDDMLSVYWWMRRPSNDGTMNQYANSMCVLLDYRPIQYILQEIELNLDNLIEHAFATLELIERNAESMGGIISNKYKELAAPTRVDSKDTEATETPRKTTKNT